jgi:hypothetical protein
MKKYRLWLCVPSVLLPMADFWITLFGQPASYWSDFSTAREASPIWAPMMQIHPAFFFACHLGYLAIICALIIYAPKRLVLPTALMVCLWHILGFSSWVFDYGDTGYWLVVLLSGVFAYILVSCWKRAGVIGSGW